jgi:RNA polymerase sigma-70 factor (ECF subfamily)
MIETFPDDKILEICRNSDSKNYGFSLLITKYQKQVYWLIRRMVIDHDDTDDLVQETFIKVWKNLEAFRSESGLYTWIYRIAVNEALSFLKNKKLKYAFLVRNYDQELAGKIKADISFSGDEIQLKLQQAILSLPAKQRLVFNMRYYDEIKYEELSEILGTSVGALKASYHIAIKKIEQYLTTN